MDFIQTLWGLNFSLLQRGVPPYVLMLALQGLRSVPTIDTFFLWKLYTPGLVQIKDVCIKNNVGSKFLGLNLHILFFTLDSKHFCLHLHLLTPLTSFLGNRRVTLEVLLPHGGCSTTS